MRDFSEISHPLKRDGTSQVDRFQPSLDPSSVSLDDRTDADILAFVFQYASQLTYYHEDLQTDDWSDFFKNSIPVQLALISRYKLQQIEDQFDQLFGTLEVIPSFDGLNLLIDFVFDLAIQVRNWQKALERDYTGFNVLINNVVRNDLRAALKNTIGISNAIDFNNNITSGKLSVFLNPDPVNQRWQLALPDFLFVRSSIQDLKGSDKDKINTIKNEIKKGYLIFFKAIERITHESGAFFNRSFRGKEDHEAHLALFYTFLKLFQKSRDQLNTISTKHLDFFFRKNLQIKEKPAIPDKAHLVFEPLPDATDQLVPTGTLFNAGQDANGAEILFAACNDLIVSGAQIESIQTVLVDKEPSSTEDECGVENADKCRIRGIYHAPIANSADGEGLPFENPDTGNWPTLGSAGSTIEESADMAARIGFILASPVLLLQEGTRCIDVEIMVNEKTGVGCDCLAGLIEADYSDLFCVELSGKNGWVKLLSRSTSAPDPVPGSEASVRTIIDVVACKITFEIILGSGIDSITFPDSEALMEEVGTDLPLLRITLNPNSPLEASPYCCLKDLVVQNCCITTTVCGVQDLIVQNENGLLDASTEYAPFGMQPSLGNYFYIGSREIFCKNWKDVQVNLKWDKTEAEILEIYDNYAPSPSSPSNPFTDLDDIIGTIDVLQNNSWENSTVDVTVPLFDPDNDPALIEKCDPIEGFVQFGFQNNQFNLAEYRALDIFVELEAWSLISNKGFIRIEIEDTSSDSALFYHDTYPAIVVAMAPTVVPQPPYIPMLKCLILDYTAKADNDTIDLIHLHPFENGYEAISPAGGASLFPQYTDEGHLYIGFNNMQPGNNLHLLFQLAESTTDPYLARTQVNWHYLVNNIWKDLRYDLEVLADETLGLTQPGIIQFAIPYDISVGNTILDPNLYWIRASVQDRAAAVANTISIFPHAVKVEFQLGSDNDLLRLEQALPAGSISTPVNNIPGVQGFEQPYDAFGGRPPEVGRSYYVRTSEHLRHKGRGISIFDYERLVLEAFPEIFKVKCISHTLGRNVYEGAAVGFVGGDFEMAPGFVTLAVIPDLSSDQIDFSNKLEPKVPAALLERIRLFLKDKISPFICLRVMNPFYERICVDVKVKFKKGKSIEFSKAQLNLDIQRFLSPWAFGEPNKIIFGGRIFRSNIVNFIEQLDYIDYIQSFAMSKDGNTVTNVLEANKARSILVSDSKGHRISDVVSICCEVEESTPLTENIEGCIGYEILGSDYLLGTD